MRKFLDKTLLNDHVILGVILLNSIVIYLQETGLNHPVLLGIDLACTLIFLLEMIAKHVCFGAKAYWQDGWNRMDGCLVILSLPSLVLPFLDVTTFNFSVVLTLRLVRVVRFLRVFHFFPNIAQIGAGLKRALRDSGIVLIAYGVLIILFGLINCSLYREIAPEYFSTPLRSIYSVFRVFTVEGWYEIPDAIAAATSPLIGRVTRLYFCVLLAAFGILGLSFINSVFVDAMVEDNNDDVKAQLQRMEDQLARTEKQLDELKQLLSKSSETAIHD
ncbi:MAG: ion transporter [Paludibacteraceae bacterium]|nr:ion transporter [Paludibacteraceae bacterium]